MKAEDTLQYMFDFYGDLYSTRQMCLNHLFCVIGNGYVWKNGELINKDSDYLKRWKLIKSVKRAREPISSGLLKIMLDRILKKMPKNTNGIQLMIIRL